MSKVLKIKHGAKSTMPTLAQAEMGFVTDSGAEELWIGNGAKNIEIARKDYMAAELTKKLDKTGGTIQDETGDYEATLLPTGLEVSDGSNYSDLSHLRLEFTEDSETPYTTTLDAYKLEFNHSYENDDTGEIVNRVVGVVRGIAETTDETAAVPYGQMMEKFTSVPTLKAGTAIPAGADLNSYITVGNYYCEATADAIDLTNRPSNLSYAFTMQVSYANGTANYIRQELVELNGVRHLRFYDKNVSKAFTEWRTEYSTANKPNIADLPGYAIVKKGGTGRQTLTSGSYLVGNGDNAVLLKSASDVLNDIEGLKSSTFTAGDLNDVEDGLYRVSLSTANVPVSGVASIVLSKSWDTDYAFQLASLHNRDYLYYRVKTDGTWGSWKTIYSNGNLAIDTTPTSGSTNPVTSGGVYNAINNAVIGAIEGSY